MTDKLLPPIKIFHMEGLVNLICDFEFKGGEMYLDASQDTDAYIHLAY